MYLIIDTETTGLPIRGSDRKNSDPKDYTKYDSARLVEIGWKMVTEDKKVIQSKSYIIRPIGYKFEGKGSKIHNISYDFALQVGRPIQKVLAIFLDVLAECNLLIAHNMEFDKSIILSEMYRYGIDPSVLLKIPVWCTMLSGMKKPTDKYPKLIELYKKLDGGTVVESHRVGPDINMTEAVFWSQKDKG